MADSPADRASAQPKKRIDNRRLAQIIVAAVAFVYGVTFVVLNHSKVRIHFIFFTVTTQVWVGLLVCLVAGALLGQALGSTYRRRRSTKAGDSTGPVP
jgi:uncharacterized integral membrane protein